MAAQSRILPPSGLPWQAEVWQAVAGAWQRAQMPHALLLSGPAGLGKALFARDVSAYALCESPDGDRSCGACRSCTLLRAGNHPDLYRLTVEGRRHGIGIDRVRELGRALAMKSLAGGYKVAILDPAERMTISAANALLKTLEEPAASTLLILICVRPSALPATILSRCLRLRFVAPAADEAIGWLQQQHGEDDWRRLLALARGAPLAALALRESGFLSIDRELAEDLEGLAVGQADPLAVAARWQRHDLVTVLEWLHSRVCDLVRSRLTGKALAWPGASEDLQRRLRDTTLGALFTYLDKLQALRKLAETPMNRRLALEDLLIPWCGGLVQIEPEV